MSKEQLLVAEEILDSLNNGAYICDKERRITHWSKAAERITGRSAAEVMGRHCHDSVLAHIDQDGRHLCGKEFCPLHRSMVTDRPSTRPSIVFGLTRGRGRIPMSVSVAPIHDEEGRVVGGLETFSDFSETYADLERARRIQALSLELQLPKDARVRFTGFYLPHDMVGGDYFAVQPLDTDRYGFLLADVMGHGVAAALHAVHLSALWARNCQALTSPTEFARRLNGELCKVVKGESFAAGICGVIDVAAKSVRIVSGAGTTPLVVQADGGTRQIAASGLPFGAIASADYEETAFSCAAGDALLMFTDGATEVHAASGKMLGPEGLLGILKAMGYPGVPIEIEPLQEALLRFSNEIRLADDLTLLEVRFF